MNELILIPLDSENSDYNLIDTNKQTSSTFFKNTVYNKGMGSNEFNISHALKLIDVYDDRHQIYL